MASALDRLREYWDEVAARNYGQAVQNRSGQSPEGALRDAATFAAEMSPGAALRDAMAESSALMRSALSGDAAGAANSVGPLLGAVAGAVPAGAIGRLSHAVPIGKIGKVNPSHLEFREAAQTRDRLDAVRSDFPDEDSYSTIVTIIKPDGTQEILDGHHRATVAMERGDRLPATALTKREYDILAKDFDDQDIAYAALTLAGDDDSAALIARQFPGADVHRNGGHVADILERMRADQSSYADGGAVMSPSIKSLADYLEWKRFADGGDADGDGDSDGGADSYADGPGDDGSSGRSSEVTPGIASEVDPSDAFGFGEGYAGLGMANPGFFNDPMGWAAYQAYKAVENPVQTLANYAFGVPYMSQGLNAAAQAIGQGIAGLTGTDPNAVEGAETGHPGVDMSGTQPIPMPQQPPQPPMPQPQQPPMPPQPGPQPIPQPPTPYTPSLADLDYIKRPLYMAMGGAVAPDIVGGGINRPAMFADGGTVSGLIGGGTPGRADAVPASLEQDGYVIPADVVSAMGDGNTQAGAIALSSALGGSPYQASMADGGILARVAHGEYYLDPDDVKSAGGPRRLDQFVKSTRAGYIDKLKKLKGPRDG